MFETIVDVMMSSNNFYLIFRQGIRVSLANTVPAHYVKKYCYFLSHLNT